jgi:AcrR family transcriptional regulator
MRQSTARIDGAAASRDRPKLKQRRTNPERSATARRKLIAAALKTLYEQGYGATTAELVARRAKVSRGAMLHHFRTRVDLMASVAEHVVGEQVRLRRDRLQSVEPGPKRFFAASEVSWEIQKQPATIAVMEILLASRSDRALRLRLAPLAKLFVQLRTDAAVHMMRNLGVYQMDLMVDLQRIHLATLRGLALERLFSRQPIEVERARQLLTQYEQGFVSALMSGQHQPLEPAAGDLDLRVRQRRKSK